MRLRELRKSKNLTQQEISKIINVAPTTYLGYEKELREPPIDILCKLADFYNVTLDYLVDRVYINDIGYLDDLDRNIIKLSKELNQANKIQALAYISGLLTAQK